MHCEYTEVHISESSHILFCSLDSAPCIRPRPGPIVRDLYAEVTLNIRTTLSISNLRKFKDFCTPL